ncbi:hypothetical protein BDF14DRAFT_1861112 [Spinellus fusiger]|nr:hypothetical protein BDF14DRAFT_1861112 [Spinellus fusiger]
MATDDLFPTLIIANEDKKKQLLWTDITTKKKVPYKHKPVILRDPFAGMKSCVDYEAEIERLKALVPKAESRKRIFPRPKSTGSKTETKLPHNSAWHPTDYELRPCAEPTNSVPNTTQLRRHATSPSRPKPSVLDTLQTPCTLHTPLCPESSEPEAPIEAHSICHSGPVISEEERARFIEFVRTWTGGWRGWESGRGGDIRKSSSLWAEQTPWDSPGYQRRSLQEPLERNPLVASMSTSPSVNLLTRSEPCTPLGLEPRETAWPWPIAHMLNAPGYNFPQQSTSVSHSDLQRTASQQNFGVGTIGDRQRRAETDLCAWEKDKEL